MIKQLKTILGRYVKKKKYFKNEFTYDIMTKVKKKGG